MVDKLVQVWPYMGCSRIKSYGQKSSHPKGCFNKLRVTFAHKRRNSRVKKSRLIWFLFIFLLFLQLHSYIQSLLLKLVQFSVIWVVAGLCGPNGSEMRHFWSCLVQKGICLFQISIPCIQLLIKCITRVEIEKTIGGF